MSNLKKGDLVTLPNSSTPGEVVEILRGGSVKVSVGSLNITVKSSELKLFAGTRQPKKERAPISLSEGEKREIHKRYRELDLHGMRVVEALAEVEQALNKGVMAGMHEITIVHGFGTGVIRDAVYNLLKSHPLVSNFLPSEGNPGSVRVFLS